MLLEADIRFGWTGRSSTSVRQLSDLPKSRSGASFNPVLWRKALVVLSQSGFGNNAIAFFAGCDVSTVRRWINRGTEIVDLYDRARSGRPAIYAEATRLKTVAFYCQTHPLPGCGRWSLQWAALHLEAHPDQIGSTPSRSTIHRILSQNRLKPHRSRYFLHITDPDFFPKMEHLVALYMHPPKNLFFFDECPGIQILKRLTPDMQTDEMKIRLEEFEYIRNGTMDVFAFLNNADGKIYAECHGDHKTATFLEIFNRHVSIAPVTEQLHYVMDNLSTHCGYPFCQTVADLSDLTCPSKDELKTLSERVAWLQSSDKRIVIHFTPYHGSWLNLVEIWFGIMGKKVLGESFGGPEMIMSAFDAFLEEWNCLLAHPFRWTYDGTGLHEKAVKRFTVMLNNVTEQLDIRFLIKELMLMTNMLGSYFAMVTTETWKQLARAVWLQRDCLRRKVEQEDGLKRKEKVEQALIGLTSALQKRFGKSILEAVAM